MRSLARGLAARTLELAGVAAGSRQLTGGQPAEWLIYGAPVAMESGGQLWAGVCAPSFILSGDQQISSWTGRSRLDGRSPARGPEGIPSMEARSTRTAESLRRSLASSKYSQLSQRCFWDRRCGVSVVCAMAGLQSLSGDKVGWLLLGRCRRASPRPDIAFDGAEPARWTLTPARGPGGNPAHVARLEWRRLGLGSQNACLWQRRGATTPPV